MCFFRNVLYLLAERDQSVRSLKNKLQSTTSKLQARHGLINQLRKELDISNVSAAQAKSFLEQLELELQTVKAEHSDLLCRYSNISIKYQQACLDLEGQKDVDKILKPQTKTRSKSVQTDFQTDEKVTIVSLNSGNLQDQDISGFIEKIDDLQQNLNDVSIAQ